MSEQQSSNSKKRPSIYGQSKSKGIPSANSGALEVVVDQNGNVEKAIKVLKRKLIKEGLFKELKSRRYYEKPSEKRKRKQKESLKKLRKEESRKQKNPYLF
ncbi:MAG: 30S ribosomal protein S21 [Bdellovibrionales bacterium]|nr:30S ribosomal protein S21 [Bdellovibrionales bacterium]